MKQRLRTFNALLTLALLHQNKPPPQYTRDRTPTAREVNTRPPPRGVSEAQGTPTPAHTNRAHVTGHPAGRGTRDPWRQPYNATEEKTFNNLCSKQPPNEKCYFIRHQPYHLFAISKLKPFFRTRVLRTKITNTTDPWVMLDYRNMNMVIRAIGRGIASPNAVPRRPPSPSDRATGRNTARSRSPPKKASQQPTRGPPDDILTLLPALPAGPERQEGLEAEEEENEREEVPDTPMQPIIIHPDRVAVEGVEARYSRTLFGVPLLRDEDIAAVDPELLIQLTARAVTPGVRLGTPEFEGHRVVEGFPEVNVAVGAMPEHAQVTGQSSEATDVVHRVSLAGPHVAITGMPWVTREGSRGPERIAAEMFDLLTQAGFRLAKGRGQGVFVPKTDFRDYATAFVTFAPHEGEVVLGPRRHHRMLPQLY